jgi:hypothetical protein
MDQAIGNCISRAALSVMQGEGPGEVRIPPSRPGRSEHAPGDADSSGRNGGKTAVAASLGDRRARVGRGGPSRWQDVACISESSVPPSHLAGPGRGRQQPSPGSVESLPTRHEHVARGAVWHSRSMGSSRGCPLPGWTAVIASDQVWRRSDHEEVWRPHGDIAGPSQATKSATPPREIWVRMK